MDIHALIADTQDPAIAPDTEQTENIWDNVSRDNIMRLSDEAEVKLSPAHKYALKSIFDGHNTFLTGAAGTGKSTFLRLLQTALSDDYNIITLAPTGVAALNVGGQTIHSFFKFKASIIQEHNIKKRRKNEGFKNIDLLVIDEISMVRADIFQAVDWFLRKNGRDPNKPFGGIQILLIGDLYQLPPIVSFAEKAMFASLYESPFFFHTNAFYNGGFNHIELSEIHRQTDPYFANMLGRIRTGHIDRHILSDLNSRHLKHFNPDDVSELLPMILTGRNDTAEDINFEYLDNIEAKEHHFEGKKDGDFKITEQRMPAPQDLYLKVGARVMFTKNDGMQRWVNGSFGIVERLTEDEIFVRVGRSLMCVTPEKWETLEYEFNEEKNIWVSKVVGTYTQFPLTLAWAITIHKSQGQTLDSCIIKLDGRSFADGQLYVALSRCKSFETLFLCDEITYKDVRVSKDVKEFYRNC